MGRARDGRGSLPLDARDTLDRVTDKLAAVGLALAGAELRGACPDELRGLSILVEDILRDLRVTPQGKRDKEARTTASQVRRQEE